MAQPDSPRRLPRVVILEVAEFSAAELRGRLAALGYAAEVVAHLSAAGVPPDLILTGPSRKADCGDRPHPPVLLLAPTVDESADPFERLTIPFSDRELHLTVQAAVRLHPRPADGDDRERAGRAHKLEAVGQLTAALTHGFNNLLTVAGGYGNILLDELPAGDPRRGYVVEIQSATERAGGLIRQLQSFCRHAAPEPTAVDLNAVVLGAGRALRRLIGEGVRLDVCPSPTACPTRADAGLLEQVVVNLVANARDALPRGGTIRVATREVRVADWLDRRGPAHFVALTVSDDGEGMTDAVVARLFEPFFTTKPAGRGVGLGLAVAHGVVERAGGHVTVETAVGRGSTFTVYLPFVPPDGQQAAGGGEAGGRGGETVLLVEDEEPVLAVARRVLEGAGYTVFDFARGEDAIRFAAGGSHPIHVLLSDVVMPELTGPQVAAAVRAIHPRVAVVYMSGYFDDTLVRYGVHEMTDHFIQKPFSPAGLKAKVRATLDAHG